MAARRAGTAAVVVAVALAASACSSGGTSGSGAKAGGSTARGLPGSGQPAEVAGATPGELAKRAVTSLGSSPASEIGLSLSQVHAGTASKVASTLQLSIAASSGSAADLAASHASLPGVEVQLDTARAPLVELRYVERRVYLRLDLRNLALVDQQLPTQYRVEIAALDIRLGERWFELPPGIARPATPRDAVEEGSAIATLEAQIRSLVVEASHVSDRAGPRGVVITARGSLTKPLTTILPQLERLLPVLGSVLPDSPSALTGSYRATFDTDHSGALTSLRLQLAVGAASAVVGIAVSHRPMTVNAPPGAVPFPARTLEGLVGLLTAPQGASGSEPGKGRDQGGQGELSPTRPKAKARRESSASAAPMVTEATAPGGTAHR